MVKLALPPRLLAVQLRVMPVVSVFRVSSTQPMIPLTLLSASLTVQSMPMSITYQPLLPSGAAGVSV